MTPEEVIQRGRAVATLNTNISMLEQYLKRNHAHNRLVVESAGSSVHDKGSVFIRTKDDNTLNLSQYAADQIKTLTEVILMLELESLKTKRDELCR